MNPAHDRATAAFRARYGRAPAGVAFAPGRVNLIGEHVDYNGGLVLPMALRSGTAVAWAPRDDRAIVAWAEDFAAQDRFTPGEPAPPGPGPVDWRAYVRGVAACGPELGVPVDGADLVIAGTVPRSAGLSSSASLGVAAARALAAAAGVAAAPGALARTAQAAEHRFAGVRCGIMDPLASAGASAGHALLIDCRTHSMQPIALPADWAVLVVPSGVERGLADSEYNARREQCEAAARALEVSSLRDATLALVESAKLDPLLRRRARHVVTEIARTAAAAEALRDGDLAAFGGLLRAGQRSLREDFETSIAPVDRLVAILDAAIGAEGGARMTGAGFGGAVVAVCSRADAERVAAAARAGYRTPTGEPPTIFTAF